MPITALAQTRRLAAATTLLLALAPAVAQPLYAVTPLPALPGSVTCTGYAVNDAGDVVGACNANPAAGMFADMAVQWRGGAVRALGRLPKGEYSTATSINTAGTMVGDGDLGDSRPQGWVSVAGGAPVSFFSNKGGNTHALFVADDGSIGGYYTKSLSGWVSSWRGAIWTPDPKDARKYRTQDLPMLPGGIDPKSISSLPQAFNRRGQAAGQGNNDQIGQHAVFWNNDAAHSIVDLGVYGSDNGSSAWGLNDLGQVVGQSHPPFGSRPMLWHNDAAHTAVVLPLPAGLNNGSAQAINNAGHALGVGWYSTPGTWDTQAVHTLLWRDGGVWPLQDLLDSSGATWTLTMATAINGAGQIVAQGTRADGRATVLLLTPLR